MFDQIPIRRAIGASGVVLAGSVGAKGEGEPSLQQVQAECSSIAQQTGSNPNAAAMTTTSQPQAGGRARGAAAGVMAGAAKEAS
jgi:hypothetical protein